MEITKRERLEIEELIQLAGASGLIEPDMPIQAMHRTNDAGKLEIGISLNQNGTEILTKEMLLGFIYKYTFWMQGLNNPELFVGTIKSCIDYPVDWVIREGNIVEITINLKELSSIKKIQEIQVPDEKVDK